MFAQRSFLLDLSKELNKGNISYAQFFLLGYLANEDYLTMTDISKKMGHSTAAATGLVDRLEKLGYVQRLHAADDRRKVMVQITRKGIEMVSRLRNAIADSISEVMVAQEKGTDEAIQPVYSQLREFIAAR
jgi:DNA-binding MarR family transcriptional regulator